MSTRIEKEKEVVGLMIRRYCLLKHKNRLLCERCAEILRYAENRLANCPYGEEKKFCSKCKTHCYEKTKREEIKEIMRTIGPRMIFMLPVEYFRHLLSGREVERRD